MSSSTSAPVVRRELLFPFIIITTLFALWGFANDLTNPMVSAFKKVMPELSNFEAYMVQFAFYFGYFFMALPAALFIRRFSYKAGILVGLALYSIGAFMFFPAAALEEFTFFLVSLWVLTCGLAFLETTANPLVLSLGDPSTATRRLNLAQAFNPVGSLTGMIIAQVVVIEALRSDDFTKDAYMALSAPEAAAIRENDLGIISLPYIALGAFVLFMLVVFALTKIPQMQKFEHITLKQCFNRLFANKRYLGGVVAQAFYVGAQIMCWTTIFQYVDYMNESRPATEQLTATWYNMAAMGTFLAGRWLGTGLMKNFHPPRMLMLFGLLGAACCAGAILLPGMLGLFSLVAISLFMSIMFPTIYGIALADMGEEAKIGSAGLVMAIVGGALMPLAQGAMLDLGGDGFGDVAILGFIPEVKFSFILPMICLLVVAFYGYRSIVRKTA